MKTAFVTGADRGLGFSLCEQLIDLGYQVIAGRYMTDWPQLDELKEKAGDMLICVPLDVSSDESVKQAAALAEENVDSLDLLINCAGILGKNGTIREEYDFNKMLQVINTNAIGAVRAVNALLPLLDKGSEKRIWCISSEAGSIAECKRIDAPEYQMSKAALNMAMVNINNLLEGEGYDIRLYHPGWIKSYMWGTKGVAGIIEPEDAAAMAIRNLMGERPGEGLCLQSYNGKIWPW